MPLTTAVLPDAKQEPHPSTASPPSSKTDENKLPVSILFEQLSIGDPITDKCLIAPSRCVPSVDAALEGRNAQNCSQNWGKLPACLNTENPGLLNVCPSFFAILPSPELKD